MSAPLVLHAAEERLLDLVHYLEAPVQQEPAVEHADRLAGVVHHRSGRHQHQAVGLHGFGQRPGAAGLHQVDARRGGHRRRLPAPDDRPRRRPCPRPPRPFPRAAATNPSPAWESPTTPALPARRSTVPCASVTVRKSRSSSSIVAEHFAVGLLHLPVQQQVPQVEPVGREPDQVEEAGRVGVVHLLGGVQVRFHPVLRLGQHPAADEEGGHPAEGGAEQQDDGQEGQHQLDEAAHGDPHSAVSQSPGLR